jgi:hypothetical protein
MRLPRLRLIRTPTTAREWRNRGIDELIGFALIIVSITGMVTFH